MFDKTKVNLGLNKTRPIIFLANCLVVILISFAYLGAAGLTIDDPLLAAYFILIGIGYLTLGALNLNKQVFIWFFDPIIIAAAAGFAAQGSYEIMPLFLAATTTLILGIPLLALGIGIRYIASYNRLEH